MNSAGAGSIDLRQEDALLLVDVQVDFLPGGALAVARGDEVLEPLRQCAARFARRKLAVIATRDWHPPDHCSFRTRGGPWPAHCVAGTPGAALAPQLELPPSTIVVSKGQAADRDAYSGFEGTSLFQQLQALGVRRVFIGGLATDYCVLATVRDALAGGFEVKLLVDAIRAVSPGDGDVAIGQMVAAGADPCRCSDIAS